MSYTVVWTPKAERLLTQLWVEADSPLRLRITQAAREIDVRLKRNPQSEGESRTDNQRILFAAPLGVIFELIPQDQKVRVAVVWSFDTH